MKINLVNPKNGYPLIITSDSCIDSKGNNFPIVNGVIRIAEQVNYTENFGVQWNIFDRTQLDRAEEGLDMSYKRLFAETGWKPDMLTGLNILEVGSGAGRFSKVLLENTKSFVYSVDYSDAVTANFKNHGEIAPDRFKLFQASVYEMPFSDDSFDKVFCFGVLQHTPDIKKSIEALVNKTRPGGEIVVDFYPINGWWTKLHAKYILRPWTKNINHDALFKLIDNNIDWLIISAKFLRKIGLGFLTRFLPLVDLSTLPKSGLSKKEFREWALLDTFDMFSPEYDQPQKIETVVNMFRSFGVNVTYSGFVEYSEGHFAAVVRAIKE